MEREVTASRLLVEEDRLKKRRYARRKMRAPRTRSFLLQTQIHSSPKATSNKMGRASKKASVLLQYKNKLCLYMVEEINTAYKAMEDDCSSSSEVGLSIDEEDKEDSPRSPYEPDLAESTIRSLFYQSSSKVPNHIKQQLRFTADVHFYELISAHVATGLSAFVESNLLEKCQRLIQVETFPALFAMLFYQYSPSLIEKEGLWPCFVKGLGQVFQHDANQGTIRLTALYHSLREKQEFRGQSLLRKLLTRYYYYYCSSSETLVSKFLNELGISLDEFLLENIKMLEKSISPKVTERYLQSIAKLKSITAFSDIKVRTNEKLQAVLIQISISGDPYNPSGDLKKAAQKCLDHCYTKSKLAKRVLSSILVLDFKGVVGEVIAAFSPFNSFRGTNNFDSLNHRSLGR